MIKYYSPTPLPQSLPMESWKLMMFWGAIRDLLWILLLLLEIFLSEQPAVRHHHSLPPVIALCLSLPPGIWLGSWALYLTDSMARNHPMHALAWVIAFYGRSRDPQI